MLASIVTTPPPEIKAGAKDLAGFIDAPEINARKKICKPTIPPMAINFLFCLMLH